MGGKFHRAWSCYLKSQQIIKFRKQYKLSIPFGIDISDL